MASSTAIRTAANHEQKEQDHLPQKKPLTQVRNAPLIQPTTHSPTDEPVHHPQTGQPPQGTKALTRVRNDPPTHRLTRPPSRQPNHHVLQPSSSTYSSKQMRLVRTRGGVSTHPQGTSHPVHPPPTHYPPTNPIQQCSSTYGSIPIRDGRLVGS